MSYYQLISLKLQMGIDPDASVDYKTLLKMWKSHQQESVHPVQPAILQNQRTKHKAHVSYLP